jgi:hypothetical protein
MAAYRDEIDRTTRTIERRARHFRNQVITVAFVCLLSIGWALLAWSPAPLSGIVLLVPVCGAFFVADSRLLDTWRADLLARWVARDLDMAAFRKAIRANPALPKETTEGMLATLPSVGDLAVEHRLASPTRRGIAAAALATHRTHTDAIALKTVAAAIAGGALIVAAGGRRWQPLVLLVGLVVVPGVGAWLERRRLVESEREVSACRGQAGFSEHDYARVITGQPAASRRGAHP